MAESLVIVVTGSNRGVGKGIVQLLAEQQHPQPLTIYATSRSGEDVGIRVSSPNEVVYSKLDIRDPSSIQSLFKSVKSQHTAVDILINNAAVCNDNIETPETAAETVNTNYGGTRDMCAAFLSPENKSRKSGMRIVNVTSGYNNFSGYGSDLQDKFRSATTSADFDALAESYIKAIARGQDAQQEAGWGAGARSYKVSKALINALTILLAKQHGDVLVNSCCPGWVDTAMGNLANGTPPKTPEEGARVPVRLAVGNLGSDGDADGRLGKQTEAITGRFFENDSIIEPGWGKAKLWLES